MRGGRFASSAARARPATFFATNRGRDALSIVSTNMSAGVVPEVFQEEPRPPTPLTPRAPEDRLVLIDGLRGMALLGILLVNMGTFSHSALLATFGASGAPAGLDR